MSNHENIRALINIYSGQGNMLTIPKVYIELTGDLNTALLLNQIIFWSDKTKRSDGFFYKTYSEWEEETLLTEYQVRRSVKKLTSLGYLETKLKRANGSPTLHYKFNSKVCSDSILKKLKERNSSNSRNVPEETQETLTDDYTYDYTDDNNNTMSSKPDKLPYEEIIGYLNLKTDSNYRHKTASTRKHIKARFNEGFTLDDFKAVIDKKTNEWKGHEKWGRFLRPETLFGTKFESYLNQQTKNNNQRSRGYDTSEYDNLF